VNRKQWAVLAKNFEDEVSDITASATDKVLSKAVARATVGRRKPRLVDLGCGIGTFVARFGKRFHEVIAVDFSHDMLRRAQATCRHLPQVKWLCADIPSAVAGIGTLADLTVCLNVITSPSAAKRRAVWRGVAAVTKPGGTAMVVVPALESAEFVANRTGRRLRRRRTRSGDRGLLVRAGCVQKFYLAQEVAAVMKTCGFEPVKVQRVEYPWTDEGVSDGRLRRRGSPWDWLGTGVLAAN
jgi:SAM-dependent methyltransferase